MKVAFVCPAEPFGAQKIIPTTVLALAAVLRAAGMDVRVIDARLTNESADETMVKIKDFDPDVLALSGLQNSYKYIKELSIKFKEAFPERKVVAGGYFIFSTAEWVLPRTGIDVACIGEGDDILAPLITCLVEGTSFEHLTNIGFYKDGTYVQNEMKRVESLDDKPLPAYDLVDMWEYLDGLKNSMVFDLFFLLPAGRGCRHHCYYCGNPYRKICRPSIPYLLKHMDLLHDEYGISAFAFNEENAYHPRQYILDLCEALANHHTKYVISVSGCPHDLDEEIITALKKANCREIMVAVEHWNPEIIKKFFRTRHSKGIIHAWELMHKHGLNISSFNILWGHPEDTKESFKATFEQSIEFVRKYRIGEFSSAALAVYPNSKYFNDVMLSGKIPDFEHFMSVTVGFGPYVNITKEDDDNYRSYLRGRQLIEEMKLNFFGCLSFLKYRDEGEGHWGKLFKAAGKKLAVSLAKYTFIKVAVACPPQVRSVFRDQLERVFLIPMYKPDKDRYVSFDHTTNYYNPDVFRVSAKGGSFQWVLRDDC